MKLDQLLTDIQSKVEDQNKSRRDVIADIGKMSLSAALAAIPFDLQHSIHAMYKPNLMECLIY